MRVLLTGHQGYLGTVLAPVLTAAGHDVFGLDSGLFADCVLGPVPKDPPGITMDLREITAAHLKTADAVVHLAALPDDPLGLVASRLSYEINLHTSIRLARLARDTGVRRFLYASTCSVYGTTDGDELVTEAAPLRPGTLSAEAKVRVEDVLFALADADFCPVSLRLASAFGLSPRLRTDLVLNSLVGHAMLDGQIRVGSDGTRWRSLVHVADVAAAFAAALVAPQDAVHSRAFNVGTEANNVTVREIADAVTAVVPGSVVTVTRETTRETDRDPHSCRMDFTAVRAALPDFHPRHRIGAGAREIYRAYLAHSLTREAFERRFTRLARLMDRQAAGQLTEDLRPCVARP